MKTTAAILAAVMVMNTGCASYLATQKVNAERVIQFRAQNGGMEAGVDIAGLSTGYLAAWGAAPGTMTGATVIDILTGFGVAAIMDEVKGDTTKPPKQPTYQIQTGGGDVIFIGGNGTVSQRDESGNSYK
jgi:hypothetical protein